MISFLYKELWAIQFYQVLYGKKYWEYVMLNWENKNTSRMIRGKNMKFSRDLSNRNTSKVLKFGVWSIHSFWAIKSSPFGLTGLKLMSTIFHISLTKMPLWVKLWKMLFISPKMLISLSRYSNFDDVLFCSTFKILSESSKMGQLCNEMAWKNYQL